jgi:hypothetical protein
MALFDLGEVLWQTVVPGHDIPAHIDPQLGAVMMAHHMGEQLRHLPKDWVARQLTRSLSGMDLPSVMLAQQLVQHQALGPNFRIDAAKDVGAMQAVRKKTGPQREQLFLQEVDKAANFWQSTLKPARDIYPAMSVIAELTDLALLAGHPKPAKQALDRFNQVFNGSPDMDYVYPLGYQMLHHSPMASWVWLNY